MRPGSNQNQHYSHSCYSAYSGSRRSGSAAKGRGGGGAGRGGGGMSMCTEREVDAYRNPTRLFELIDAGDDDAAIRWVQSNPAEAATWLVSRRSGARQLGDRYDRHHHHHHQHHHLDDDDDDDDDDDHHRRHHHDDDQDVKWRYLPLHVACLRPSPSLPLVRSLHEAYPKAVRKRDRAGNLPVHYVCHEGTEDDWEVLEFMLDMYPDSLNKASGDGRTLAQLVQDMGSHDEGSLATNGTLVARVSHFDARHRRRENQLHHHRYHHHHHHLQQQQQQQQHDDDEWGNGVGGGWGSGAASLIKKLEQRSDGVVVSRGRSRSRGRHQDERRDDPPSVVDDRLPRTDAGGGINGGSGAVGGSSGAAMPRSIVPASSAGSSRTKKARSKSRRRGGGGEEKREDDRYRTGGGVGEGERTRGVGRGRSVSSLPQHTSSNNEGMSESQLRKKVRELEGKLDAALTERDVLTERVGEMSNKDKARRKEIKDLRTKLNTALKDADEDGRLADVERRRSIELEALVKSEKKRFFSLESKLDELESANRRLENRCQEKEAALAKALESAGDAVDAQRIRAEALEVERGLRTKIELLEKDLRDAKDEGEKSKQLLRKREAEAKDQSALQLLNASLQDQIAATKTKCNELERKLKETGAERDSLQVKLQSSQAKDKQDARAQLKEQQKRLHKEFNMLWSAMQKISKDNPSLAKIFSGDQTNSAKAVESLAHSMQVMTAENEAKEKKIKSCRLRIEELESEKETLTNEAKRMNGEMIAMEEKVRRIVEEDGENDQRLSAYENQIKELQAKNKSLRENITKNNETYVAKVKELSEECRRLNNDCDVLHQTIRELQTECNEHRRRLEKEEEEENEKADEDKSGGGEAIIEAAKRAELSNRIAAVASFLVKISDMQDRIVSYAARMEEEMQARAAGHERVVSPDERDELANMAKAARERGLLLSNAVAIQKRELEAIAAEINHFASQR